MFVESESLRTHRCMDYANETSDRIGWTLGTGTKIQSRSVRALASSSSFLRLVSLSLLLLYVLAWFVADIAWHFPKDTRQFHI